MRSKLADLWDMLCLIGQAIMNWLIWDRLTANFTVRLEREKQISFERGVKFGEQAERDRRLAEDGTDHAVLPIPIEPPPEV